MVRIELGGKPLIDLDTVPGDSARLKEHVRRKIRGGGRAMNLSWNKTIPRLVLTSDTDDFDPTTIQHFKEEGFQMSYLAYTGKKSEYTQKLQHLQDPLELGEKYAIVAYGDAAALVLEACMKPMPKLVAVIAYYPPYMPRTTTNFPPTLNPGFAEYDLDEFDKVGASLAWSRTLAILREAFDMEPPDLEAIWDSHMRLSFTEKNVDKTMATMVAQPYVNHIPTMTGGIGHDELRRFYDEFFIPNNPPDLAIKLLSRTIGVDRIVDEMFVKFTHTTEMPWMLPGVPPTNKKVEVVLVSVVCVRGGKLFHEHVHWDQASLLVQVGLIDPKFIPDTFKTAEQGREDEVERLPVLGREAARKALDEDSSRSNKLIPDW